VGSGRVSDLRIDSCVQDEIPENLPFCLASGGNDRVISHTASFWLRKDAGWRKETGNLEDDAPFGFSTASLAQYVDMAVVVIVE
jgi:hypothetical protein